MPAVDLSSKQKHPPNNADHSLFRANSKAAAKILRKVHDVGSEYAVYMVGPPAKSAFWQAPAPAGGAAPVLDAWGRIAYTSAVPERIGISTPAAPATGARDAGE
jgi:hypothetical protein